VFILYQLFGISNMVQWNTSVVNIGKDVEEGILSRESAHGVLYHKEKVPEYRLQY
jgi:hypothetical protein